MLAKAFPWRKIVMLQIDAIANGGGRVPESFDALTESLDPSAFRIAYPTCSARWGTGQQSPDGLSGWLNNLTRACWLAHNHPSGDPTPSTADIEMTRQIVDIAAPLGIAVHDHIIVGKDGHASLRDLKLMSLAQCDHWSRVEHPLSASPSAIPPWLCRDPVVIRAASQTAVSCESGDLL